MPECTCFELPPEMWHTHYGAIEPGSTHEPNPECPEHFPKNRQYCKDCLGAGSRTSHGMDFVCPTCDGTGTIHRTGPYKLKDGSWSDGVDRSEPTRSWDWGKSNPFRLSVICAESDKGTYEGFFVYRGNEHLFDEPDELFHTHAEAIAYADRMARTNQGDAS